MAPPLNAPQLLCPLVHERAIDPQHVQMHPGMQPILHSTLHTSNCIWHATDNSSTHTSRTTLSKFVALERAERRNQRQFNRPLSSPMPIASMLDDNWVRCTVPHPTAPKKRVVLQNNRNRSTEHEGCRALPFALSFLFPWLVEHSSCEPTNAVQTPQQFGLKRCR